MTSCRQNEDRTGAGTLVDPQISQDPQTRHLRHQHVQQDQVRRVALREVEGGVDGAR
jgi:hypothetical protein